MDSLIAVLFVEVAAAIAGIVAGCFLPYWSVDRRKAREKHGC